MKQQILSEVTFIEKQCLIALFTRFFKSSQQILAIHNKKLVNLWKKELVRWPESVTNLSSKKLDIKQKEALRFGLSHHILPKKFRIDELKVGIEKCMNSIKRKKSIVIDDDFKDNLKFICAKFTDSAKRTCSSRNNIALHRCLNSLSKEKSLKVCKQDKGNGITILNSDDYDSKLERIISDKTKFSKVMIKPNKLHSVIAKEKSIEYFIRKYLKNVDKDIMQSLIPTGSKPGKLYGLIKVHKINNPARPVVSMIGTPEYKLAKFLDSVIKPSIPDKYMLSSTNHFIEKLKQVNVQSHQILVSFNVVSLFTNVPLAETIQIIANYLFGKDNPNTPPMEKHAFIKLMKLATQGMFLYNGELFKQIDAVAMRSPPGPTLANFFLENLENKLLN